jgi:uncharacterized membrane protein YqjE
MSSGGNRSGPFRRILGQTPMSTAQHTHESSRRGIVGSFSDVVSDIAELAELQCELARADLADSIRRMVQPAIVLMIGVLLLAAGFPVLLVAIAAVLNQFAGLSVPLAMGIASLVGFVIGSVLTVLASRWLRNAVGTFERSKTELRRNVAWLKSLGQRNASPTRDLP